MSETCKAELHLADDFGDNHATIRCQLPEGHPAHHSESFTRSWGGKVAIYWERDERTSHEEFNVRD